MQGYTQYTPSLTDISVDEILEELETVHGITPEHIGELIQICIREPLQAALYPLDFVQKWNNEKKQAIKEFSKIPHAEELLKFIAGSEACKKYLKAVRIVGLSKS